MDKGMAIERIHKMGHAGQVLATIAKVFIIIGIVGVIIGTVAVGIIPKGGVMLSGSGNAVVTVDGDKLGLDLSEDGANTLEEYFAKHGIGIEDEVEGAESVTVEGNVITLEGVGEGNEAFDIHSLVLPLIMLLLMLGSMLVVVWFAGILCKDFRRCESPFEEKIVNDLKKVAFSMIPLTVFSSLGSGVEVSIDNMTQYDWGFSPNVSMIIATLIVFALAYIFKYGAVLQQESDETL